MRRCSVIALLLAACRDSAPAQSSLSTPLADAGAADVAVEPAAALNETPGPLPLFAPDAGSAAAAPIDTRCGTPPEAVECPEFLMTFDELFRTLAADIAVQRAEDRPFLRYIGLVNRRIAGVCGAALDVDRWALNELLNSLSTEFAIALPEPIDAERTIYRVDIRRYGWDRPVAVGYAPPSEGVDPYVFSDGWEAIQGYNPYALPFVGGAADTLVAATETRFPYASLDHLLDVASVGNLYYALLDIDTRVSIDDFELQELNLDRNDLLLRGEIKMAGFRGSGVSSQPREVQRYPFAAERVYWKALDFADDANESLFDNPLGFIEGATHAFYNLPNLLPAYLATDANGTLVEESEVLFGANRKVVVAVDCMGCHSAGVLPFRDQVTTYVQANQAAYDTFDAALIQQSFVPAAEMDALIEQDRAVTRRAFDQLGIPAGCPDPVAAVYNRFSKVLQLRDALGDLGVSRAAFEAVRAELEPSVSGLLNVGLLERRSFASLYWDTMCAVTARSEAADAVCATIHWPSRRAARWRSTACRTVCPRTSSQTARATAKPSGHSAGKRWRTWQPAWSVTWKGCCRWPIRCATMWRPTLAGCLRRTSRA